MAVNVCRLARKTNLKSRKEQQTEELDAPRLPMWSLNPFAHSLHETSPHFSVTGSRGILVDQISITYLYNPIFHVFFPFDVVWAQPKAVWRHPLIWGRPPLCGKFCQQPLLRQVNLQPLADFIFFPLPSSPRAHYYWDGLSKIRVQWRAAIPRRRWWQNSARDCFPFQVHKYCIL